MQSSNPYLQTEPNPAAPFEQLGHWLGGATVHVLLGLAVGMIAARLIRGRRLHWSWAAIALGPVMLVGSVLRGSTLTLGVAALAAARTGRRWHREDIEAGGDLAGTAARRRTPVDVLRYASRAVALRRRRRSPSDSWFCGDRLILGCEPSGATVSVPLGGGTGGTHTLVVGATGSGKTITQTWIAARAIERGMGAVVIDPKGDRGMRHEVRRAAASAGRPFIEWTPGGPAVYNPYAHGTDTEIADKALAGERFTEPHYLRQAQRYLGHAVRVLHRSGLEVTLNRIVHHLDPAALECLARQLPEFEAQRTHAYLDSLTARQRSELAGVRDRLAILAESDVGPWLDPESGARQFHLLEAVKDGAVVYFRLESDMRPLVTQMLGAAIVQDLQVTVAALQGHPVPTLVVIDEFSAVAADQVVRLFGRSRSAGLSLLLGTQELSDLRLPGRERLLEQVMGNLSVLIAHRQVVPASAELIASLAGTRGAWRTSRHSNGGVTRTRTRESVLGPDEVMRLGQGWAAVMVLTSGGVMRIARVFSSASIR